MNNEPLILDESVEVIIFTDSHCLTDKVSKIRQNHPDSIIFCLGDFTYLFKSVEEDNSKAIDNINSNNIKCLKGNHEDFIAHNFFTGEKETLFITQKKIHFNINKKQAKFLYSLPISQYVIIGATKFFLCHNQPHDLWGTGNEKITNQEINTYFPNLHVDTNFILTGHLHREIIHNFTPTKLCILNSVTNNTYYKISKRGIEKLLIN